MSECGEPREIAVSRGPPTGFIAINDTVYRFAERPVETGTTPRSLMSSTASHN